MYRPFTKRALMIASASAALLSAGCAQLPAASAPQLDTARFADIDQAIDAVIAARGMPGAVFHLERNGDAYEKAYGHISYEAGAEATSDTTLFDAASLTKILATAPSVLLLAEAGKLDLEAPLIRYFPECGGGGKEPITVRHLLTHSSGLPAGLPALPAWEGQDAALALACAKAVTDVPGTAFRYSDINFILLGQLVQRVSGMPLDEFAQQHIFAPLKMLDTGFLPLTRFAPGRIAPTHVSPLPDNAKIDNALHPGLEHGAVLQGVVHDPTARRMGGVAGSAGVFTSVGDLARYARMLLAGGILDGVRILSPTSVRLLTTVQSPPGVAQLRGMGMDIDSPFARPRGALFPVGSYGHTGFTGCILWIDPGSRTFYAFLSNRVYPDDKSNILPLYDRLGTLAAQSALGYRFGADPTPVLDAMNPEQDYEQLGRIIYGAHGAGFQLALLMERMGKPMMPAAPGEKLDLARDAAEADAMFARLAASATDKTEFSALMHSLAGLSAQLHRLDRLTPQEIDAAAAAASGARQALARFRSIVDQLAKGG
jgi:CubicO group peptidase (beta-lactamase class C family)